MKAKLNCIMLVDDNPDDNFFHELEIKKDYPDLTVIIQETGMEALDHLKSEKKGEYLHPQLIFLDINMPGMNGWEFLEEYNRLEKKFKSETVIVMLTISESPDDIMKSKGMDISSDFKTKPLTQLMLKEIIDKHFT